MALNFDLTKVKDLKAVKDDWQKTEVLIWATMSVGIDTITEKNATEFYKRLHLAEVLNGSWLSEKGKPLYITEDEVKARIGLSTNASRFSRTELHKRQLRRYWQ